MTEFEITIVVFTSISCLISLFTIYYTIHKNKKNEQLVEKLNSANLEVMIAERISVARVQCEDLHLIIAEKCDGITDKKQLEAFQKSLNSKRENYLNAFDDACSMYVDDKIDKERFKKNYRNSILQIFSDDNYKKLLNLETACKFQSLLMLYRELS